MKHTNKNRGFTLIEMLVVIAIIAILVSVILPVAADSTKRAKAATDAANMRAVYAVANAILYGESPEAAISDIESRHVECKSFEGAKLQIVFADPAFVDVYFVDGENYYSRDYFGDVAADVVSSRATAKPDIGNAVWYTVGEGEVPVS